MDFAQPEGFLALPSTGKGPGVLVLHPWWGLNATIKAFCARLADNGFITFAPDLYHGKTADTIPCAEALAETLDHQGAKADVKAAADFLGGHPGRTGDNLAVIGFSLGAFFALDLSASDPRIASVVIFYGVGPGDFNQSHASYLGHFAENDVYESPDDIAWLEGELSKAGRPVTFYHYPDTGHWFFEPDRQDAFSPTAADLAWERTLDFLNANYNFSRRTP